MIPTERDIQAAFWMDRRSGYRLVVPNYTPAGWFECDLWCVTKAGYALEFEIKRTVSDFKKDESKQDRGKLRAVWCEEKKRNVYQRGDGLLKYARLAQTDSEGPSQFSYIVPEGLLKVEDVPEWAGLVWVKARSSSYLSFTVKKKPKRLHKEKPATRVLEHAQSVFYWRFWNDRFKQFKSR